MKINDNGIIKTLPTVVLVNECEILVSTLAQAERFGRIEYVPPAPSLPTAEDVESQKNILFTAICEAARVYVEQEFDAAGMILVDRMLRRDPPNQRAQECDNWVASVYYAAEYRKAMVTADMWPSDQDVLDFNSFGKKPHTIAQLLAEF